MGKAVDAPDAILVRSFDMRSMVIPSSVKAIGRAGAGTNNIPVDEMSKRGVPVFNAPGANANAVKELVLAAMLMAARNLIPALGYVATLDAGAQTSKRTSRTRRSSTRAWSCPIGRWASSAWAPSASLVADTAIKLGMKVIGFDPEINGRRRVAPPLERAQGQ